jgi:tRNA A-37 threonylcarbamoyl transferase component Bud32
MKKKKTYKEKDGETKLNKKRTNIEVQIISIK